MTTNYDRIADAYHNASDHPIKKYCESFRLRFRVRTFRAAERMSVFALAKPFRRDIRETGRFGMSWVFRFKRRDLTDPYENRIAGKVNLHFSVNTIIS